MTCHIEDNTARHNRRHIFDTEFGKATHTGKVFCIVTVVVDAFVTGMTKAVDLRPNTQPTSKNVVVIGHFTQWAVRFLLIRLNYREGERARRKGRHVAINCNAKTICFAGFNEPTGFFDACRRNSISGTHLIIRSPLARFAIFSCHQLKWRKQ